MEQGQWAAQVTVDRVHINSVYQKAILQTESGHSMVWSWEK